MPNIWKNYQILYSSRNRESVLIQVSGACGETACIWKVGLSIYLKYFYSKHTICNTSVFCIFYFTESQENVTHFVFKIERLRAFFLYFIIQVIRLSNVNIWNIKYKIILYASMKYKIQNIFMYSEQTQNIIVLAILFFE